MDIERERVHAERMKEIADGFRQTKSSYKSPYAYSASHREEHVKRSPYVFRDFREELDLGYEEEEELIDRYTRRLLQRGGMTKEEARKRLIQKAEQYRTKSI